MSTSKRTVAELLAERIATFPRVESARASGNRIRVRYPREFGGVAYLTLPAAKRLIARHEAAQAGER